MYPSVAGLMVAVCTAEWPTIRFCTELPSNVEELVPVVQFNRFGGSDDEVTMDRAYVDVDVWHSSLTAAEDLASELFTWMRMRMPGKWAVVGAAGPGVVASCRTQTGMYQRPAGNDDLFRVGGAFTIRAHSFRAS